MPSNAVAEIRRTASDKARKAELKRLDTEAQAAGFESHAAAFEAAKQFKRSGGSRRSQVQTGPKKSWRERRAEAQATPARGESARNKRRYEAEITRLKEEKRKTNRARARSDRRSKELTRKLDAQAAETSLRIAAARSGVKDVDYALHVLKQELQSKSPEELAAFNENNWFKDNLKTSHPYLYETRTTPATTGTTDDIVDGGDTPPPPPGEAPGGGASAPVDAKKMSREEYAEYLAGKGLANPTASF